MTVFYDSARWGLIPAGADAALYADGRYACPPADRGRFRRVRLITVLGGAYAGAADFEAGNLVFEGGRLRDWALARQAMDCRARVYASRSNIARAHSLVGDLRAVCYWVPTLDGREWAAEELAASIEAEAGVVIPLEKLWAVQYKGGPTAPCDESILYGTW